MEIFKPILGREGYEVSSLGRVKSLPKRIERQIGSCLTKELIMKPCIAGQGYRAVYINKKIHYLHRLVAIAFIPNPENLPEVNHKDGDKANNKADNLEWSSRPDNINHAFKNNLIKRDASIYRAARTSRPFRRPVLQVDKAGRIIKEFESIQQASRITGIAATNIVSHAKGKHKTSTEINWKYK